MARVTVEDCIDKIPNRYELLMVAAQRAKDLSAGAPLTVAKDNDKNPVIALREIADGTVNIEELQKSLVEELEILAAEKELSELDDQFSGISLEAGDMSESMQIREGDDSRDIENEELDNDTVLDDTFDDTLDVNDDFGADFDEEE